MEKEVKPVLPTEFRYYVEQHYESILKDVQDRKSRYDRLEEEIRNNKVSDSLANVLRTNLLKQENRELRQKRTKINLKDFKQISILGKGSFGTVKLVKDKWKKKLYALKEMSKENIIRFCQSAHIRAERDAMIEMDNNDWVVKLFYTFQDDKNLYMIMEYVSGGDLRDFISNMDIIPENVAKFIYIELTLAIEAVHSKGFIHRDLKPDNILITSDGHVKLGDFGLSTGFHWSHAKEYYEVGGSLDFYERNKLMPVLLESEYYNGEEQKMINNLMKSVNELNVLDRRQAFKNMRKFAHSIVGTILYMAPEMVKNTGHDTRCDWWSFGVIVYEMQYGFPPFYDSTINAVITKIIDHKNSLVFPSERIYGSDELIIDLLKNLINTRKNRFGGKEIREHPYFADHDWNYRIERYHSPCKEYLNKDNHDKAKTNTKLDENSLFSSEFISDEKNSGLLSTEIFTLSSEEKNVPENNDTNMVNNKLKGMAFYKFDFKRYGF